MLTFTSSSAVLPSRVRVFHAITFLHHPPLHAVRPSLRSRLPPRACAKAGDNTDNKDGPKRRISALSLLLASTTLILTTLHVPISLLLHPLSLLPPLRNLHNRLLCNILRLSLFLCGVRIRISNRHKLPAGNALVVCNQQTALDVLILAAAFPCVQIVPHRALRIPGIGWLLCLAEWIGAAPGRRAGATAFASACKVAERKVVCLFPGGLDRNGMNNRFPALCFKGIGASDVGVVPVGVAGTDEMFRDGVPVTWPRRGVHVVVGDCIAAAGSDKEVAGLSSEAVRNALLLAKQNSTS